MKNLAWILAVVLSTSTMAQNKTKTKKVETIEIQTSAVCDMCKELIIDKNLVFEKGLKYAEMDVETGVLTVKYRNDRTSAAHIRNLISDLGYSADSVLADPVAYDNLHFCCKKKCE
jgi:mercuric ion binding protein